MILNKPYSNLQYADLAVYCNNNGCYIEDRGDYLEAVKNPQPLPPSLSEHNELIRRQREKCFASEADPLKHDYDKVIKKRNIADKTILILDQYQREQDYRKKRDSTVKFNIDDEISHPKFGKGIIEQIEQLEGSVRLHIRFGDELKKIDQKWLLKSK